jgi:hypothetical protein
MVADIRIARIIHDVRFRLWRGSRGEAVCKYRESRMTNPETEDDIAFGEENHGCFLGITKTPYRYDG